MRPGPRIARAAIVALALLTAGLLALTFLALTALAGLWAARPLGPLPPPPTLLAPSGPLPTGPAGLEAWAHYQGEVAQRAGSGFLLRLADGRIVGVIAAHSVALGDPGRVLQSIAFALPGVADYAVKFDHLLGLPGRARSGADMTVDYIFLATEAALPTDLALEADPRGGPLPGEQVLLYSGAGDGQTHAGTVLSAEVQAVWIVMDETFDPGLMSGSPLVSGHTGQVVGMAIAAAPRGGRLTLGFHPIGSLVRLAEAANTATALAAYKP